MELNTSDNLHVPHSFLSDFFFDFLDFLGQTKRNN